MATLSSTLTTMTLNRPMQIRKWSITLQRPRQRRPHFQMDSRFSSLLITKLRNTSQMELRR